jgi:hypothetical protein
MTPTRLAVVVEGTPLQQDNRYAGGSYSSSEEEDDSPPLLDLPAVLKQFATAASPNAMAAALAPDSVETVLGAITESEQRRNSTFDSNMAALGGRHSRLVQMLSDVRGDISRLSSESSALIELNRSTRLSVADINRGTQTVADTMADFLRSVEASETQHRQALEASETRNRQALAAYRTSFEQSLKDVTGVHAKTMDDIWAYSFNVLRQIVLRNVLIISCFPADFCCAEHVNANLKEKSNFSPPEILCVSVFCFL